MILCLINPIGFPFIVLSWIEGTQLEWSDTSPSQREDRDKILHQMVDIVLESADRTKEFCRLLRPRAIIQTPAYTIWSWWNVRYYTPD